MSIGRLEILARRGYLSIPTYDFEQEYDDNGNLVWKCECHIEEYDIYFSSCIYRGLLIQLEKEQMF